MKKKNLLFLLLMALFAPWAANAQETANVVSGGTGTNPYVPMYNYYNDYGHRSEYIIPASYFEAAGINEGDQLTSMTIYRSATGSWTAKNLTIILTNTTISYYDNTSFLGKEGTTVYSSSSYPGGSASSYIFPFTEPFEYTGGSLVVHIWAGNGGTCSSGSTASTWLGYSSTTNSQSLYAYGSNSASATTGTFQYFLPNTTFTYTPGGTSSCPKPTNLTVSNLTSNSATVNWESDGNWFHYQYRESGGEWIEDGGYGGTGSTFASLTEVLEPNTTYEFRVQNICNLDPLDESAYATTQFTTACGAITSFPWTEDFENYASGNFTDPCWVNEHISGGGTSIFKVYTSTNGTNSTHQLQLPDQSGGTLTKLVLPEMTLPGDNYEFMIDVYRSNSTYNSNNIYEGVRVYVSTDGEIEGATELAFIPRQYNTGNDVIPEEEAIGWYTYELPIGISGTCYIILRGENQYCTSTYMDNFKVKQMPTCLPPTGLHVAEVTAHSVRIEWDAEEGAMFQEDFNTMSFDPNTPPTDWNTDADYDNFATWSGLEPEHFYGIWVRKYCSADDQSEPIYITFTTPEACPAPTGLHVVEGSITSTGASFAWDAEAGATFQYFTIEDPLADFVPTDEYWSNASSSQNNTAGWANAFTPNSVERFYLRKNCGDDGYSDYTYVEFHTLCGSISLTNGYSEDFDDYTAVSTGTSVPTGYPNVDLPYCWQFLNLSESTGTYPQAFLSSSTTYAVSGNCLFFKSSSTTPLYAILPEFVQGISEYQLTFTYRNEGTGNNNGKLYVGYMTDPSNASTFVQTLACEQTTTKTPKTAYFPNAPEGSFMAFKYEGGTSNNYYLGIDNVVVSNGPACFPTGTLSYGELSTHTAQLSWDLVDQTQDAWVVEYSLSPQFLGEVSYTADASTHENFVLTGLEAETQYYARVRGNCGDGSLSDVSNTIIFTTLDACLVPTNLAASNLTQVSADLTWTGSEDVTSYSVKYNKAEQFVGINEQFNTSSLTPEGWEVKTGLLSDVMGGAELSGSTSPYWHFGTYNGVFDNHAYLNVWGANCKSWLITPSHIVKSGENLTFDLALTAYSGTLSTPATTGTDDRFVVLVTLDNGQNWEILREWNNSDSDDVYNNIAHTATGEQVSINMYDYVGCEVRIAFYGESTASNADNNLHIDNVKIGTEYAAGGAYIVQTQETTLALSGLDAGYEYEVRVKSDCSNPEEWSEPMTFTTLDANTKVFIGGQAFGDYDLEKVGDKWWNPNNWVPYGMPGADNGSPKDDVIIRHDAVIAHDFTTGNNIIANANSITFEGDPRPTLTLEDGNQLLLNTNIDQPDVITVKKNIIGYAGTKDQYYLISTPAHWAGTYNPANGIITTESDYDLYDFDPAASDGLEWRNYKAQAFSMQHGEGYLYANAADVQLRFTGPIRNNRENYTIWNMSYDVQNEYEFNGWDLSGNPFTCNAYLSTNSQTMAFYRMNAEGTGFEAVTSVIKPMEGFFMQNTVNNENVVLSRTAPSKGVRCLNLVLSQVTAHRDGVSTGSTTLDNAIVRFDEGNTLEKLSFREGSSKVYMPIEGKDYAVVNAGQMGELPVSFKAESNGSYTLSFTNEEVEFSYLHLIDNMTGEDIDLLAGASTGSAAYTFEARTTDYANRFKLVFVTGSSTSSDTFAFYSNGSWVINNPSTSSGSEATLQVIDVTGRILSSENINGSANVKVNAAPGVYMLRLVNGNDVKVQKVVVK